MRDPRGAPLLCAAAPAPLAAVAEESLDEAAGYRAPSNRLLMDTGVLDGKNS